MVVVTVFPAILPSKVDDKIDLLRHLRAGELNVRKLCEKCHMKVWGKVGIVQKIKK